MKVWKKESGIWLPQMAKDEISGKLRCFVSEVGDFKSKGYVIETEDEIRTAVGSVVLDRKIRETGIKEGDHIRIVFLGTKGDKEYKDFDLFLGCEIPVEKK
jgi:hypothetical protein